MTLPSDLTTKLSGFLVDLWAGTLGVAHAITSLVVSAYVQVGSTVASTGAVRLANNTGVYARNAANSADVALIASTSSDLVEIDADSKGVRVTGGNVLFGTAGGAKSLHQFQKTVTGIADNTATTILTVTVPNGNHAAGLRLLLLSSNGSTDAYESARVASGLIAFTRTTGANAVATVATIDDAALATVAAGATHTLAYSVGAVSGAVGATNTFPVQVTIDDLGNLGSNQCVVLVELLNAAASGVTVA